MTRDELMGYVGGYIDGDGTVTTASVDNGRSESLSASWRFPVNTKIRFAICLEFSEAGRFGQTVMVR